MTSCTITGVRLDGICACLPKNAEDNLVRCEEVYGSMERAQSVVKATGINRRRIVASGESSLDLCVTAAKALFSELGTDVSEIGAVICVTFTPERSMPCNACQAQARLGLGNDVIAFDVGLACSGYAYGLYVASLLATATGRKVLLLDGDVQSPVVRKNDESTVPVLADAGSATIISPCENSAEWHFAFRSQGEDGAALVLPRGGEISMDGFSVFKFVAMDVCKFIREFLSSRSKSADDFDWFVPHQANVYMIRQLAKSLKFPLEKLAISGDEVGNSASATVPVTMAWVGVRGRVLLSGFGGGLSASVASVAVDASTALKVVEI